jgi:hypothetical protein
MTSFNCHSCLTFGEQIAKHCLKFLLKTDDVTQQVQRQLHACRTEDFHYGSCLRKTPYEECRRIFRTRLLGVSGSIKSSKFKS